MTEEQTELVGTEVATMEERTPAASEGVGPGDLNSLMRMALEKGSVDGLERLVALQERVSERNARAAFFQALADFREACPPIQKTRENSQFKVTRNGVQQASKYAPLEEIDRVARPVAAECGLVWTWDTDVDNDLMHVTCRVIHVDGHFEEASVSMPYESKAGSSPQQKYGSAQTYGMRYSLIAALGLTAADEDVDGDGGEVESITEEQVADLEVLIDEIDTPGTKGRILTWVSKMAGVPANELGDIPVSWYDDVVDALEKKRGQS